MTSQIYQVISTKKDFNASIEGVRAGLYTNEANVYRGRLYCTNTNIKTKAYTMRHNMTHTCTCWYENSPYNFAQYCKRSPYCNESMEVTVKTTPVNEMFQLHKICAGPG